MKIFGLGFDMEQFKATDMNFSMMAPANKIIFSITPIYNFRFEPEVGYYKITEKESDLTSKSLSFGIGALGMYQRNKVNIYGGLRFEYTVSTSEYTSTTTGNQTAENKGTTIGPVVGAEYLFSQHFSIGGEIGGKYSSLKTTNSQYSDDSEASYILTQTGLFLRFYF